MGCGCKMKKMKKMKKKKVSSYGGGGMVTKPKTTSMYKKGGSVKKKFKVHKMYKGKKVVIAKTMADHNRLKRLGYTHTKPKK